MSAANAELVDGSGNSAYRFAHSSFILIEEIWRLAISSTAKSLTTM